MRLFIISLFVFSPLALLAQRQTAIGLNFTAEITSEDRRVAGLGVVGDFKITKHSGFETGMYLRTYTAEYRVAAPVYGSWLIIIAERHLSLPVLYKYYSRIVNLAAGPSFDFYTGWKQKTKKDIVSVSSYTFDPEFNVGIMGKISKRISLSRHFVLEPEIRLNLIPTSERSYVGIGIVGKYIL